MIVDPAASGVGIVASMSQERDPGSKTTVIVQLRVRVDVEHEARSGGGRARCDAYWVPTGSVSFHHRFCAVPVPEFEMVTR